MLDKLVDFKKDGDAISKEDAFVVTSTETRRQRETTKGLEVLCNWKDGSSDVKDSYPMGLVTFAVQNKIADELVFAWWVPYTLKKKGRIISKIKSKYWDKTHKY